MLQESYKNVAPLASCEGLNNVLTFYWFTIRMLVGQPVVFSILELEVGVAELALLGSKVFEVLGAVISVA